MTALEKPKKITAADIRAGMSARFADPEWAIMWEVGESTGGASGRYADAVMMSLWPSRGLELHGVEIKVSRSDWKREAADPRKAEAVGKYCDRWWIHTPPGIVQDLSEVPPAWGVREFDGAKWRTLREAEKNPNPEPVARGFLAALLRRADGTMRGMMHKAIQEAQTAQYRAVEDARSAIQQSINDGVTKRMERLEAREKNLTMFEEAFGQKIPDYHDPKGFTRLGRLCAALDKAGIDGRWDGAVKLAERMAQISENLKADLKEYRIDGGEL